MFGTRMLMLPALVFAPLASAIAQEQYSGPPPRLGQSETVAPDPATGAPGTPAAGDSAAAIADDTAPPDVCGTHERIVRFAREAGRLVTTKEAPYFMVRQRLMRVNDHYVALHEALAPMMPPHDDIAAEALWRFDALGELLQESSENLEHLAHEMQTAERVCNLDVEAYENEFGAACSDDSKVGCAEEVFLRYCTGAKKRNRVLKVDAETQTGFLKWPRFFDHHWAGPTKVGEAGEGWREEWTYGTDEQVWSNLGRETAQDENRLEMLALTEQSYSTYTMIDTKPLLVRMVYNTLHGNMQGSAELSLGSAIDRVGERIRKVMRCATTPTLANKPTPAMSPQEGDTQPSAAEGKSVAGVE